MNPTKQINLKDHHRQFTQKSFCMTTFILLVSIQSIAFGQSITVTSPTGGEILTQGESYTIEWTTTGEVQGISIQLP